MGYDGYIEYGGKELFNIARTYLLSQAKGVGTVRMPEKVLGWLRAARGEGVSGFGLGGFGMGGFGVGSPEDYSDITLAPWFDGLVPASYEFYGFAVLSINGLDDSTLESTPVEYVTDGGHSGKPRNATLPLVFNVGLVASTDRGADYGKKWLDRRLRDTGNEVFCSGADLVYYQWIGSAEDPTAPMVHRRDVRLTRGTSVTRKKRGNCAVTWMVTFTMTAADPFEYGAEAIQVTNLGSEDPGGDNVNDYGSLVLTESSCPVYDYTPIYDPTFPALVAPPTAPEFLPTGWGITEGMTFERYWAQVLPADSRSLLHVPVVKLMTSEDARMVRVSIWDGEEDHDAQCDPLWSAVVTYLPADMDFIIDGEQKASYAWDGYSAAVRRTDSLVYSPAAKPIEWTAFNHRLGSLLVTLDIFTDSDGVEGGGNVRASVSLVPKSD